MSTSPLFTVIIPVHRPPDLLPFSLKSVLSQTLSSFELWVLCDGAPAETVAYATAWAEKDPRVQVFPFPKGERHGEAYRHQLLMQANGKYVAYLSDDDFWFPNHLEEMEKLLDEVDFGNLLQTYIHENAVRVFYGNLNHPDIVSKLFAGTYNFFGPTTAGHRLSVYKNLKLSWTPAPTYLPTDLFMWQKFLARRPALKVGTRVAVTSIHFPTCSRQNFSRKERIAELEHWYQKMLLPRERNDFTQTVLNRMNEAAYHYEQQVSDFAQKQAEANAERLMLQEKNQTLLQQLTLISHSLSWKWTRPLRAGKKIMTQFLRAR